MPRFTVSNPGLVSVDPDFQQTLLTSDGALWSGRPLRVCRTGVALDDPLAVATTMRVSWGVRSSGGPLRFEPL